MRKYQQQQILELLKTIETAQSVGLFGDCQDGAIQIGEFIESIEREGTQTVALLEEYCNLLFKASKGEIREKQLRKFLIKIENSVKDELKPNKIEVVFFPYKASMADSFETIYLAAKDDPQCDVYWIPIPYFERNPDGSFGQMHYEGGEYPDYLEVIDWQKYDVKARRPDIVFIHNPYDECNYVTSVHPDYYSKALKVHTDFLVYVNYGLPYWMPLNPSLSVTTQNASNPPYLMYYDLIVSYSNEHAERNKLILLLAETTKGLFNKRQVNEKVVALGSAKFDKVLKSKKEDYTLPDSWLSIAGNKKILLYNTSLADLLKDGEKNLNEMSRIIDTFSKRDDIVLWWRPHPLTDGTIRRMRPELKEKYTTIIEDYKSSGLGIFDDTSDIHRAIAWSDGCLTNLSSVMYLYLASGKPFVVLTENSKLPKLTTKHITDFHEPLLRQIKNMKAAKGANIYNSNFCIRWANFIPENIVDKIKYDNFLDVFADYIVHMDEYQEAEEYKQLQLQMFRDFVVNPDGTAGEKIYRYCKERVSK